MLDPRQLQVTNIEQVLSGNAGQHGDRRHPDGSAASPYDFVASVMTDLNLFNDPEFNTALQVDDDPAPSALPALSAAAGAAAVAAAERMADCTGLASQPEPVLESDDPGHRPAIVRSGTSSGQTTYR